MSSDLPDPSLGDNDVKIDSDVLPPDGGGGGGGGGGGDGGGTGVIATPAASWWSLTALALLLVGLVGVARRAS
ncbi:MAG: hypothetical protein WB784_06330 [Rhodanobacteraceae bacterium]